MPKKIIRKFKTKPRKRNFFNKTFKKNNKLRAKINYPNSTKVQTFGPGSFKINIEQNFVVDADAAGLYQANVAGYINDAVEFHDYQGRFMFYKIEQIGITIFPNDELKNLETGLGIDWFNVVSDAQGFLTWDSKKYIFNNNIRTKTFFFKIPNTMLEGYTSGPWNFRNFNATNINLPGKVCLYIPGVARVQGRIVARVAFKVPRPGYFGGKTNNQGAFKKVDNPRLINIPKSKFGEGIFQDPHYKTRFKIENYLETKAAKKEENKNDKKVKKILKKAINSIERIKNKYKINDELKNNEKLNKSASEAENKADYVVEKSANISIIDNRNHINHEESFISSISLTEDSSFLNKSRFSVTLDHKSDYIKDCWYSTGFKNLPRVCKQPISIEEFRNFVKKLNPQIRIILKNQGLSDKYIKDFNKVLVSDFTQPNNEKKINKRVINIIASCFLRFLKDKDSGKNEEMEKWFYILRDGNPIKYLEDKRKARMSLWNGDCDDKDFDFNY